MTNQVKMIGYAYPTSDTARALRCPQSTFYVSTGRHATPLNNVVCGAATIGQAWSMALTLDLPFETFAGIPLDGREFWQDTQ